MSRRLTAYLLIAVLAALLPVAYATLYKYITTNATITFAKEGIEVRNAKVVEKPDGVKASITVRKSEWDSGLIIDLDIEDLSAGDKVVFEFEVVNVGSRKVKLSVDKLKSSIGSPWSGCYAEVEVDREGLLGWVRVNPWDSYTIDPHSSMKFRIIVKAPDSLSDNCGGVKVSSNDIFKLDVSLER